MMPRQNVISSNLEEAPSIPKIGPFYYVFIKYIQDNLDTALDSKEVVTPSSRFEAVPIIRKGVFDLNGGTQ